MKRLGFDLILLGDPTAGKDTQAGILMKKYALKPVESGNYWRKMLKSKTADGDLVRKTVGLGHPAPVSLMKKFLETNLRNAQNNQDLIFIGNPRLKPEAQLLVKLLKDRNRDFFVLYFKLPEKEIYKRSLRRVRTDKEASRQYIKNRINYTKHQVSKTVAYFKSLDKLKFIDNMPPIPQVAKNIQKAIDEYKFRNHFES
jgi:adenylate kinase